MGVERAAKGADCMKLLNFILWAVTFILFFVVSTFLLKLMEIAVKLK